MRRGAAAVAAALTALALVVFATAARAHPALLPQPAEINYDTGFLALDHLAIRFAAASDESDRFAAAWLARGLSNTVSIHAAIEHGRSARGAILLKRTGRGPEVPGDAETTGHASREAYSIVITERGAEVSSVSSAGLFYGVQTLLQMVETDGGKPVLPLGCVRDWPSLAWRGFMMDFSHGQLLRVGEIERQLDLLARYKANQYYFYFEMSVEWPGYEMVTPDGRYTQAEVRHVIDYARQRHIDVVPCVELYGHMHDLFRSEKYRAAGLPQYGDEFDPNAPGAMEIADDLFDRTAALFPSPWIHAGFDEPWSLGKIGMVPGKDPFEGFAAALRHMAERARQHGKRLLYWADIENGASTLSKHPELLGSLPGGAIAVPWEYEARTNYDRFVEPLALRGVATVVAPAIWNWNEIFPDYRKSFTDINGLLESGRRFHTLGMVNTGWTDCGQTLYRQSLAGVAFGAAAAWQSAPVNTNLFFSEYCRLEYPAAAAPAVAAALEKLSTVEQIFEGALDNTTWHGFWHDPLQPGLLARLEKNADAIHRGRLLAEEAMGEVAAAQRAAPRDDTLNSLMMAARLFDYLGMKCLYAAEWDGYFKTLGRNPDPKLVTLYAGIQMNAQDHGMMADLLDGITGLKEPYREAWLAESGPYRLGSALARWDAEARFWLETWGRLNTLLRTHKTGEPFPGIDALRAKP